MDANDVAVLTPEGHSLEALRAIVGDRPIWVHIDWNVLEPGYIPADYAVSGGLLPKKIEAILAEFAPQIQGLEIAEFYITDEQFDPSDALKALSKLYALRWNKMSLPSFAKPHGNRSMHTSSILNFTKIHGAGNDFVILDLRTCEMTPDPSLCRKLADRHGGVGCDLILGIGHAASHDAVASYQIWTADGQSSLQCGNGARCVASLLHHTQQEQSNAFKIESPSGQVEALVLSPEQVRIFLPVLQFATSQDFVQRLDLAATDVKTIGAAIQKNLSIPRIRLRGFRAKTISTTACTSGLEFWVGETLACGTGACTAAAGFMKQGRLDRQETVSLAGGELGITWPERDDKIYLEGPAEFGCEGALQNATV